MIKKLLIVVIVLLSVFAISSQSKALAVANPLTSPITFFSLMGKVTYKNFFHAQSVTPGKGVKITAQSFGSFTNTNVTTNPDGTYGMMLAPGSYFIQASDANHTFFNPTLRYIKVTANSSTTQDFQGLLFNW